MEENKKTYTHFFACLEKKHKFNIDTEEEHNTKLEIDKMRCPVCQSKIELDISQFSGSRISTTTQSRLNTEASQEAMRMAAEHRRMDIEEGRNKMINIQSTQKGSEGKTLSVPLDVVKSISEKVEPLLE